MYNKILCVDDDPITLMLSKKVILKSNFSKEIDTVTNGVEALNYFDNIIEKLKLNLNPIIPELLFLDLNMPFMNGWEFLTLFSNENYSKITSTIKVIILSSTIDPSDIKKSKSFTIVSYFLSKPINKEMLKSLS